MGFFDPPNPNTHVGLYIGVVTNRSDPEVLGRVKFTIPGLVAPESDWAWPMGTMGGGSDARGFYAVPEVGADIAVFFKGGDIRYPFFMSANWGKNDRAAQGTEIPTPLKTRPVSGRTYTGHYGWTDEHGGGPENIRCFETENFVMMFDDRILPPELGPSPYFMLYSKRSNDNIFMDAMSGVISLYANSAILLKTPGLVSIKAGCGVTINGKITPPSPDYGPATAEEKASFTAIPDVGATLVPREGVTEEDIAAIRDGTFGEG